MTIVHYPVCPTPPAHVPTGYTWVGVCDPGPEPWWQIVLVVLAIVAALGFMVAIGGRR